MVQFLPENNPEKLPQQPSKYKKETDSKQSKSKKSNSIEVLKYSGMAFQMGAIVLLGTLIGKHFDEKFATERPYFMLLFVLISIFAAFYLVLKDIIFKK